MPSSSLLPGGSRGTSKQEDTALNTTTAKRPPKKTARASLKSYYPTLADSVDALVEHKHRLVVDRPVDIDSVEH